MKCKNSTTVLVFIVLSIFSFQKTYSQCFEIESLLVDACATGTNEGFNEMVRFRTGSAALNSANLVVTWPNNSWLGIVQNATTAAKVASLNADIVSAGGCRRLIEPPGGIIPANSAVILVTSYLLDTTLNSFGALTSDIYLVFQNNGTVNAGHFANSGVGIRTLTMTFSGSCLDTVSYNRALLTNGTTGDSDGATVLFTPSGSETYVNNGCVAPVPLFTVNAGTATSVCAGATIALLGSAQGQQSLAWSAPSGSFSTISASSTNYTVDPGISGTVVVTLTATNICGTNISDTVTLNVTPRITPTFTAISPICSGGILLALPTISNNSVVGIWSPALNNQATTTYTFVPATGQCANTTPLTIVVSPRITPTFTAISPICSGGILLALPTISNNSVIGTWSPALNNQTTTTYTFAPATEQCANAAPLTIAVSPRITPTFTAISPICSGEILLALPTISNNSVVGTWSPALNNQTTTTYTFAPATGQCANAEPLTIVVSPKITPTFTAISPICSGGILLALPTISNNSVIGTWSPALNNQTTTTYTFAPATGQCAATTNLTINVQSVTDFSVSGTCNGNNFILTIAPIATPFNASTSFSWQNSSNTAVGTNDLSFNVSNYLYLSSFSYPLPQLFLATTTDANGCITTKPFTVTSLYCSIQKGISPNGDGDNDFFDLHLLDVKGLSIFNRYGTKVYSKANYRDEWRGETDGGNQLPDGTYYYVVEFNSNSDVKTGWVYINK